jgi:hypothetical protein
VVLYVYYNPSAPQNILSSAFYKDTYVVDFTI